MKKIILALIALPFLVSSAMAAPVKFPGRGIENGVSKRISDSKLFISAGVESDNVLDRELEDSSTAEFNAISGEIALEYDKKIKGYVTLGQVMNVEFEEKFDSDVAKIIVEDKFIWGVGLAGKTSVLEVADLFGDLSYRMAEGMGWTSVDINGTIYQIADIMDANITWREWHAAVGISKDFKYITPYAGIRYSDAAAKLEATVDGTLYKGSINAVNKMGVFVGARIVPAADTNIHIQGRFIDETALMVSASLPF